MLYCNFISFNHSVHSPIRGSSVPNVNHRKKLTQKRDCAIGSQRPVWAQGLFQCQKSQQWSIPRTCFLAAPCSHSNFLSCSLSESCAHYFQLLSTRKIILPGKLFYHTHTPGPSPTTKWKVAPVRTLYSYSGRSSSRIDPAKRRCWAFTGIPASKKTLARTCFLVWSKAYKYQKGWIMQGPITLDWDTCNLCGVQHQFMVYGSRVRGVLGV